MPFSLYISQFFYRIRHWLFFGTLIITALVYYFSQFLSKAYTSSTSIYAGVTSAVSLDESQISYFSINSTFDNLINLTKARGTLEKVAIKLLAQSYVCGNPYEDTEQIKAVNYRALIQETPQEILKLIDKKSQKNTAARLTAAYKKNRTNFVYRIVNSDHPFFSCNALSRVDSKRLGSSDLIEIQYTTSDPGLAESTVRFISEELLSAYEDLRFSAANDVVAYFERELKKIKADLAQQEESLIAFNKANDVINYFEQTKALAIHYTDFHARYEETMEKLHSSDVALNDLKKTMDIRNNLLQTNVDFLAKLDEVAKLTESILQKEIFSSTDAQLRDEALISDRKKRDELERYISSLSDNIDVYTYSKEGINISEMALRWLDELIINAKAKAQLKVMDGWKSNLKRQYQEFSPVGTLLARFERGIGITEEQLKLILHGLHLAKLKQKSIQMSTATLKIVTDPTYPFSGSNNRWLYIAAAFLGSLIFITGIFLIIELLDRTLRDELRTSRLTKTPVLGAFTGHNNIKFRGYAKVCNRIATSYATNRLNPYLKPGETCIINLLSLQKGEGKSYFSSYLTDHWEDMGFQVTTVKCGEDFDPNTKDYVLAQKLNEIWKPTSKTKPNIVLVEYPEMSTGSTPLSLLKEAQINLLICNACRLWQRSDDILLSQIKKEMGEDVPMYIYLNNADRYVVENFTGDLPPQLPIHSFIKSLFSLGFTSKKASVK